jgi:hypothetical protein
VAIGQQLPGPVRREFRCGQQGRVPIVAAEVPIPVIDDLHRFSQAQVKRTSKNW